MKRKIIIDCDPGLDDSLAIVAGRKLEEIDVLGITVTAGNASLENTSRNALNLLDTLEWNIPVVLGAKGPLEIDRRLPDDNSRFGSVKLKESKNKFYSKNAVEFIYEKGKKYRGELEIFSLAPMTNIAMALEKYPDLKDMIKSISFMGGTLGKGNIRPWAEFNLFVDPHGADIVFQSGIPTTMIGLNITNREILVGKDIEYFKELNTKQGDLVGMLLQAIWNNQCSFGDNRMVAHDLIAFYAMVYPEKLKVEKYKLAIEKGDENRGKLSLGNKGEEGINIGMEIEIDPEDLRNWIK